MRPESDLSLVLPAYDEGARLPRALEALRTFSVERGLRLEIVVASDGSTDETVGIAEAWAARRIPGFAVSVVEIPHRGKGAAVRAGMRHVGAPVVGYCDVDLSAGPDAIVDLSAAIDAGADVAIASRGLPESVLEVRQPWHRELAGRLFNLALRRLTKITIADTQCGLKLFRADVARQLFRHMRIDGFAFDAELIVLAARLGYAVKEVPVRWTHDPGSRLSFKRDSILMARDTVRIVRRLGRAEVHQPGIPALRAIDRMASSEERHWWYVAKRRLVGAMIDRSGNGGRPCLDVGCGAGAMVAEASLRGPAVGIDLSSRALEHARERGLGGLVRGEAGKLPFADGAFGSVLALDVLEHHPDPHVLLAEINRVLAPNGVVIVTVPAFQWMWSYADHVLGHYRRYTKPMLAAEIAGSDFRVDRVTYFHSWLLPVAWSFRKARALLRQTGGADDFALPGSLNAVLLGLARAELRLLSRWDMPFGLSLLAVARPVKTEVLEPDETIRLPDPTPQPQA